MLEEKCVVRLKNGERSLREDTVKRLGGPRQKVCRARSLLLADPDGSEACIDHVIAKICRCHGGKRALPPPARWLPADHRQQAPSLPTNPQATIPRPAHRAQRTDFLPRYSSRIMPSTARGWPSAPSGA